MSEDMNFKKVSFLLDSNKHRAMMEFAKERGEKYPVSYIFIEAVDDYIQKRNNPEQGVDQIRYIIKENPGFLKDEIAEQVRVQLQIQLRQIFGEKFQP